jgi:hypothetical protein
MANESVLLAGDCDVANKVEKSGEVDASVGATLLCVDALGHIGSAPSST